MHHRLTQHRHHHPPQPPVEDLRMRLDRMRDQRDKDEAAGISPSEDSYIYNLPKHQKHSGYPNEKRAPSINANRSVGQTEWDQGKVLNIKIKVSEDGERMYKMDKDEVLKVEMPEGGHQGGPLHSSIVKNENEPGMKTRGRGRYRGAPRGRGYSRGRGRGGFRGRGRGDGRGRGRGRGRAHNADSASNSSEVTEQDPSERAEGSEVSEGSGEQEQQKEEEVYDDDCNGEVYQDEEEYPEGDDEHEDKQVKPIDEVKVIAEGQSDETKEIQEAQEETRTVTVEEVKPKEEPQPQKSTESQSDSKSIEEKEKVAKEITQLTKNEDDAKIDADKNKIEEKINLPPTESNGSKSETVDAGTSAKSETKN